MHTESVTTHFGRRPMTLALVRRQQAVGEVSRSKAADKWKIFRDASAAMEPLGLQSSSLADASDLLLDQARIIQGEPVTDLAGFARRMAEFMQRGLAA